MAGQKRAASRAAKEVRDQGEAARLAGQLDKADLDAVVLNVVELVVGFERRRSEGALDQAAFVDDLKSLTAINEVVAGHAGRDFRSRLAARRGELARRLETFCTTAFPSSAQLEDAARWLLLGIGIDPDVVVNGGQLSREEQKALSAVALSVPGFHFPDGVPSADEEEWTPENIASFRAAWEAAGQRFPDRAVDKLRTDIYLPVDTGNQSVPAALAARVFGAAPRTVTTDKKVDPLVAAGRAFGREATAAGLVARVLEAVGVPWTEGVVAARAMCAELESRGLLNDSVARDESYPRMPVVIPGAGPEAGL